MLKAGLVELGARAGSKNWHGPAALRGPAQNKIPINIYKFTSVYTELASLL